MAQALNLLMSGSAFIYYGEEIGMSNMKFESLDEIENQDDYLIFEREKAPDFKLALKDKPNYKSGAFIQEDYYHFIPYINLCYCYSKLSKYKQAKKYNDKAKLIYKDNELVKINSNFLNNC